ncbi:MAG TPA: response regulator [Thermosynechococcaceae cyanobacterium]
MLDRLKIRTKIGLSFLVSLGFFATIGALTYRGTRQMAEASQWEAHTYQVLTQVKELLLRTVNAETGQRGYVLTGESQYLEPYTGQREQVERKLQELRTLTNDNPIQQQNLKTLAPLISAKFTEMQRVIDIQQQQGLEAARQQIVVNRGKALMDQIRQVTADIEAEERRLLGGRSAEAQVAAQQALDTITYGIPLYSLLLILLGLYLSRNLASPLQQISDVAERVGEGDLSVQIPASDRQDEVGVLARTLNQTINNLRVTTQHSEEQNWLNSNLAEITQQLQGQRQAAAIAQMLLSQLAPLVNAQQGAFYRLEESDSPILKLLASYAHQERKHLGSQFKLGEGLVGQAALEKQRILLTDVPSDYIRIVSGLGEATPLNVVVVPILFEQQVVAVLEFASFRHFNDNHLRLLEQVSSVMGVVLNTIAADQRTAQLLQQSQTLAAELQSQQAELQQSNHRLEEQTEELQVSSRRLEEQQQELQQSNEELQQLNEEMEERADLLTAQKWEVERKNEEIEQARRSIEEKAEQLALSSQYKSEFLANMSHELRTPLNSLLILSKLLSDNSNGNLTEKQIEYSRTIHSAGNDLLELINDILDLAKIESGTMSIELQSLYFTDVRDFLDRTFRQVAQQRSLSFQIELDPALPTQIETDAKRLQQILKNLLANAFKFTNSGGVTLHISPSQQVLSGSTTVDAIAFAVTDTGIGIPLDKQKVIFEAFQQADGTTSRKYGGTGLGLSISRELATLLGGKISLSSQSDRGSTFTLYLPACPTVEDKHPVEPLLERLKIDPTPIPAPPSLPLQTPLPEIADDRAAIQPGDRVLLIIEDDINFIKILMDMARQQGFRVLAALRSSTGLHLAREFMPQAIMLDIRLPDSDGWTVLDQLKHNPSTRHIPVHILSVDEAQQRSLQQGAIAYLQKPVSPAALTQALTNIKGFIDRRIKNLLVVEDNTAQAESIRELIGDGDVKTLIAPTGAAALDLLQSYPFDCVVLDLGLPDMPGFELIERIKQDPKLTRLPIVVYTGMELSIQEETQLKRLAETIIIKDVRSPERLLDETALFLHRVQANLPPPKRQILEQLHQTDPVLANKIVLIVDDDVRNIFALTSFLEGYNMKVLYAENGRDALAILPQHPDLSAILMDVMMPEMDGYEATRAIRQQDAFKSLPIIALTAKAMQGDREKCLEAGASDYITKPVDTEQLLSLLRVWLYR